MKYQGEVEEGDGRGWRSGGEGGKRGGGGGEGERGREGEREREREREREGERGTQCCEV